MNKGIGGHQRAYAGRTDEWLTPPEIIKALGPFDLDPCASVERPWPTANHHYTIYDDGLSRAWFGRVWLNCPYGPETKRWLEMLAHHGNGIALVFARTETEMFHKYVWNSADAVFFFRGRLYFYNTLGEKAKYNAGGPSVLVAYGQNNVDIMESSSIGSGYLIKLRKA